jgi:hypothetical protein
MVKFRGKGRGGLAPILGIIVFICNNKKWVSLIKDFDGTLHSIQSDIGLYETFQEK